MHGVEPFLSALIAVQVISFACFWDVEVHCDVHKNPLWVPVVGPSGCVLCSSLIFFSHLGPGCECVFFHSGFLIKTLYAFLFIPMSCYTSYPPFSA